MLKKIFIDSTKGQMLNSLNEILKMLRLSIFITHGASEASGVRNFWDLWHLSAKILYTVKPKTATSSCVHFEVAATSTEKNITSPCIHFEPL